MYNLANINYLADGGDDGDDEEESSEDDEEDEDDDMDLGLIQRLLDNLLCLPHQHHHYSLVFTTTSDSFSTTTPILSPPSPVLSPTPPPSPIRSLGYRAAMIRLRDEAASTSSPPLQLPSASRREDIPEVTLPPQKRLDIALSPRYKVGESSSAAAARPAGGLRADYGFVATVDREIMHDLERVTERQLLAGRVNMLFKDRRTHAYTRHLMETEARMSKEAWVRATDASQITDKTGLGYDNQVFNNTMFDCDDLISYESDESEPTHPVHDRVLVTKPHNKTPYELLLGRTPSIGFMRPFGCLVTILNTLDPLRKFDGKVDEGFLVGYSVHSKAFRVFNSRTRIVQETLHINFLEKQPNVAGNGPTWLFHTDTLTQSMNYQSVVTGNQPNSSAGIHGNFDAGKLGKESVSTQQYVLLHLWSPGSKDPQNTNADVAFNDKEIENEVHVSLSSRDKPKKHDKKAKREAK
nr:retrovirus-related Pol polyprotein from transposon TNT 1-94 [Tanacetum cinerariifolium]